MNSSCFGNDPLCEVRYFNREWLRNFKDSAPQLVHDSDDGHESSTQALSVFVSHSTPDSGLALELRSFLLSQGVPLAIDLTKSRHTDQFDLYTANWKKVHIRTCTFFLILATETSVSSEWLLWELGVADSLKENQLIAVVPLFDKEEDLQTCHFLLQRYNTLRPISDHAAGLFTPTTYLMDLTTWLRAGASKPHAPMDFVIAPASGEMEVHPFHRSGCAGL